MRREGLKLALFLTGVPAAVLLAIAVSGRDVVLMWFSFLASWTGMVVVGLWPWRITPKLFRNLCVIVAAYTVLMLVGTTIDMLVKPRLRCHTEPAEIVRQAQDFYRRGGGGGEIPFVIGDRWLAGVVQFYTPNHPKSFDVEDHVTIAAFRDEIRRRGALLVGSPRKLRRLLPEWTKGVKFEKFTVRYRSWNGRTDEDDSYFALFPGEDASPRGAAKR